MEVKPSTYVREHIEPPVFIEKLGIFSLFIVHGIENFNGSEIYMASVRTKGSSRNGVFWSALDEAVSEGKRLLKDSFTELNKEYEKLYKDQ